MALLGDGTIGSGTIASPQDMGEPADLTSFSTVKVCDIGDVIELTATFNDHKTGNAAEPDSVACTVLLPTGETVAPDVDNEGGGRYVALFAPDEPGAYVYAFDGTGGHQASGERRFRVRKRTVLRG